MKERTFNSDTILVSKTDLHGKITYVNENFIKISGYSEKELIKQPHNLIRHKKMPAIVFKLLWQEIQKAKEINAYVINQCKNGDYYWVYANVTPSIDSKKNIIAYHSTRRSPSSSALDVIKPLYEELLQVEKNSGIQASYQKLLEILTTKGVSYDEFILSI